MVSHTSRSLDHVITFTTRRFTIRDHPTLKVVYKYRPGRPCPIVNPTNLVLKLVLKNGNHIPTSLSYSLQFKFLLRDVCFCSPHQRLLHTQLQHGPNHQRRCIPRCPSMFSVLSRYWGSLRKFKFLVRNLRDGAS